MLYLVTKHCAVCQLTPTYRLTIKRRDHEWAGSRGYHTSHKRDIKDSRFSVPTLALQIVTNNNTQSEGLHTRPKKHVARRTCGYLKKCENWIALFIAFSGVFNWCPMYSKRFLMILKEKKLIISQKKRLVCSLARQSHAWYTHQPVCSWQGNGECQYILLLVDWLLSIHSQYSQKSSN